MKNTYLVVVVFLHKVHFQFDFMLFSFRFIYLLQFPHTGKLCSISLSNTIPFLYYEFLYLAIFLHNIRVGSVHNIDESFLGFSFFIFSHT